MEQAVLEETEGFMPAAAIRFYPEDGAALTVEWKEAPPAEYIVLVANALIERYTDTRVSGMEIELSKSTPKLSEVPHAPLA
jgi:hypothetical protein